MGSYHKVAGSRPDCSINILRKSHDIIYHEPNVAKLSYVVPMVSKYRHAEFHCDWFRGLGVTYRQIAFLVTMKGTYITRTFNPVGTK